MPLNTVRQNAVPLFPPVPTGQEQFIFILSLGRDLQLFSAADPESFCECLENKTFQACAENTAPVYQLVCQNALTLEP